MSNKCLFCGTPDSDTVPVKVRGVIMLRPVCDDCIIALKTGLQWPGVAGGSQFGISGPPAC